MTLTDYMPEDTEEYIVRGACIRILLQLRHDKDLAQDLGIQTQEAEKAFKEFYYDYNQKTTLDGGGLELTS